MPFAVHRARGKHPLLTHFIPDSNDCFYAGSAYLSLSHCGILWALSGPLWQNPSDITTSLCPSTSVTLPAMLAQMEETQNPYSDGRTAAPAGAPKHHEDTELSLLYSRWRTLSFSYCSPNATQYTPSSISSARHWRFGDVWHYQRFSPWGRRPRFIVPLPGQGDAEAEASAMLMKAQLVGQLGEAQAHARRLREQRDSVF